MSKPANKIREAKLELYRRKGKIHAKSVRGRFNTVRWAMVWFTQLVFYGGCWLTWEIEGSARQAVLFDIADKKFYIFGFVLWPQDALLLALALIFAATTLFFITALAGRLFCGFACPQTVYTMMFAWIEAKVEGDHLARLKLDQGPMSGRKLRLKLTKHALWLLLAGWTAITFVGYFTPIRELLSRIPGWEIGPWESFWLLFYAAFTYVLAGFAREAVCQHMCPYSRFQGVMVDHKTRTVSYDSARGEPRGVRRAPGETGDCIDCGICVEVCPTGIDIRDGLQYQCINCGLCADACDAVMTRIGSPSGLVRFTSEEELAGRWKAAGFLRRPRIAVYASLLLVMAAFGAWELSQRPLLRVDVLRDRGALSRETPEGRIENGYTLKLANLREAPRDFVVAVSGATGIEIVGERQFSVAGGSILAQPLAVSVPGNLAGARIRPITFHVVAKDDPAIRAEERSSIVLP